MNKNNPPKWLKKVLDLIATFNSDILDEFENIFLNFASERLEEELPYKTFNKVNHYKFQDLLQSILTVDKKAGDDSLPITELVKEIKERQENYDIDQINFGNSGHHRR